MFPEMPAYPVGASELDHSQYVKIPAAWLLDRLGYKGRWHESFGCYEKQPLVLVHDGSQIASLEEKALQFKVFVSGICQQVRDTFNIELEIEPQILPYTKVLNQST